MSLCLSLCLSASLVSLPPPSPPPFFLPSSSLTLLSPPPPGHALYGASYPGPQGGLGHAQVPPTVPYYAVASYTRVSTSAPSAIPQC
eukprot:137327-Rhodomonas_salina.1